MPAQNPPTGRQSSKGGCVYHPFWGLIGALVVKARVLAYWDVDEA